MKRNTKRRTSKKRPLLFSMSEPGIFHKINAKGYVLLMVFLLFVSISLYAGNMPRKIDRKAYIPLLTTIAEGESSGNYNAYYGNAKNTEIIFTQMSVSQVLHWQEEYTKSGQPSNAVGKYQIIRSTLAGLIKQMKVKPNETFSEDLQDRMAITLLERRGSLDYVNDKLSRDQFAANIAKEWAALPRITGGNPEESYYAGDGLNVARVNKDKILNDVEKLKNTQ